MSINRLVLVAQVRWRRVRDVPIHPFLRARTQHHPHAPVLRRFVRVCFQQFVHRDQQCSPRNLVIGVPGELRNRVMRFTKRGDFGGIFGFQQGVFERRQNVLMA